MVELLAAIEDAAMLLLTKRETVPEDVVSVITAPATESWGPMSPHAAMLWLVFATATAVEVTFPPTPTPPLTTKAPEEVEVEAVVALNVALFDVSQVRNVL